MRKFLRQKFWSQGTPLGSLGPLSFEALGQGFDQCQILLILGPYEYLDLVALQVQAEILKTIRSWCVGNQFFVDFLKVNTLFCIHFDNEGQLFYNKLHIYLVDTADNTERLQ